jgi:transposase InsO family protein
VGTGQSNLEGGRLGKLLSPAKRRRVGGKCSRRSRPKEGIRASCLPDSPAHANKGQSRSTQGRKRNVPRDEPRLVRRMVRLAGEYGRYGYRRIRAMLRREGWRVNHKRIERLCRREWLKVPARQQRKRLWLGDGTCVRLRPTFKNHVWSDDFVHAQPHDGRPLRLLTLMDESSRACFAIDVSRRMTSENVLERLSDWFIHRGFPRYSRSDNGPKFTAIKVRQC